MWRQPSSAATRTQEDLGIDPIEAKTVRLIYRLAREGDGSSGPIGVKSITNHLNAAGIRTRDGGRWGIGAVHKVLTRTTYIGRHRFNTKFWKTREHKPDAEVVEMAVPPMINSESERALAIGGASLATSRGRPHNTLHLELPKSTG